MQGTSFFGLKQLPFPLYLINILIVLQLISGQLTKVGVEHKHSLLVFLQKILFPFFPRIK